MTSSARGGCSAVEPAVACPWIFDIDPPSRAPPPSPGTPWRRKLPCPPAVDLHLVNAELMGVEGSPQAGGKGGKAQRPASVSPSEWLGDAESTCYSVPGLTIDPERASRIP